MTQTNLLAFTALPNGFEDGNTIRLSVVLTPSISTDDNKPVAVSETPFDGWTSKVLTRPPSWSVSFIPVPVGAGATVSATPITPSVPPDWNAELWRAIFGGKREAKNRRGNAELYNGWRLSHHISDLHDRHRQLRSIHAQRSLSNLVRYAAPALSITFEIARLRCSFQETKIVAAVAQHVWSVG
jgi:hypothetical protein